MKEKNNSKEKIELAIEVPDNVVVELVDSTVKVKGGYGVVEREFKAPQVSIEKKDNKIILSTGSNRRKNRAVLGAVRAHIQNMIHGVSDKITYKLRIVYTHFPISVKVEGKTFVISNFLGERYPRRAPILDGVLVEVKGQDVVVTGTDKEAVSQTAAGIEQATKIKRFDPRVFQDGIYITEKDGKSMLKK